jgi:hypothetical protein
MTKGSYIRTDEIKEKIKIGHCKRRNRPIDDIERFWSYVDIKGFFDCWEWTGHLHKKGYGWFKLDGKWQSTHRISWKLSNGEIPKGMSILHKCDNRACCNQAHLFLGTQVDNMADMVAKGRSAMCSLPGSKDGMSKLTEEQVICIRVLFQAGITIAELARMYKISWTTIGEAVKRKTWKHI